MRHQRSSNLLCKVQKAKQVSGTKSIKRVVSTKINKCILLRIERDKRGIGNVLWRRLEIFRFYQFERCFIGVYSDASQAMYFHWCTFPNKNKEMNKKKNT